MAKLSTFPSPDVIILPEMDYAILPTGGDFNFDADAFLYPDYYEALEEAMDWSSEIGIPVRVYLRTGDNWSPIREVEA